MPLDYNSSPQVKQYLIVGNVHGYKTVVFTILFLFSSAESKSSSAEVAPVSQSKEELAKTTQKDKD